MIKINGGGEDDYKFGYSVGYKLGKFYKWIINVIDNIFYIFKGIFCLDDVYCG